MAPPPAPAVQQNRPAQPAQQPPPSAPAQRAPSPQAAPSLPVLPALATRTTNFDIAPPQGFSPLSSAPLSAGPSAGSQPGHERSFSHGNVLNHHATMPPAPQKNQRNSTQALPSSSSHHRFGNGGSISRAPPQLGALPFQSQQGQIPLPQGASSAPPYTQPIGSVSPPSAAAAPVVPGGSRPKQVFGLTLDRLYERDGLAVPMAVYQCIQAVDLYGLAVEGIYRLSGSATHIQKLKNMFDTGMLYTPP
jgi:Rho GTPase-activating protein RGD1